jgi:hypothetical protein
MPTPPGKKKRGADRNTERPISAPPVSDVRSTARKLARVSDLYGGGETGRLLQDQFTSSPKVNRLLQKRHDRTLSGIDQDGVYHYNHHRWKVPGGVRRCIVRPLVWGQIVNQYPWAVLWSSPKDGRTKRKLFGTAGGAIHFIATRAQYVDPKASVLSRCVGYDIPLQFVNKIPLPYRWCPHCMTPRRYKRKADRSTFWATRKEWSSEKQRYVWRERKLAVLVCERCGSSNQDTHMRRSNQPWETRKLKPGAKRVRRRR